MPVKKTSSCPDPKVLDGKALAIEIELTINRLILKLAQRAFKLLDKQDISGLAGILRAASQHKHNRRLWELVSDESIAWPEKRALIYQAYGIGEEGQNEA